MGPTTEDGGRRRELWRCLAANQILALVLFSVAVWESSLPWPVLLGLYLTFTNAVGLGAQGSFWLARRAAARALVADRPAVAVGASVAGAAAGMLLAYGLGPLLWGVRLSGGTGLVLNLLFVSLAVGGYFSYALLRESMRRAEEELRRRRLRELELLRLQAETELRALRAAVEPHFLFNALNTIAALTAEDPRRAEEAILRLSELLRGVVEASRAESVPLERELALVRDYLEIERMRFEDRLRYRIDVPAELAALRLPGLVLQPLVENAVKHGLGGKDGPGEVRVEGRLANGEAILSVVDDGGGGDGPAEGTGTGLALVRRRLEAFFGARARVELRRGPGRTEARLTVPIAAAGEAAS